MSVHQFDNAEACFSVLKSDYDKVLTTHLSSDAVPLYKLDFLQNIALVFGNEHAGVSEEIRRLADGNFIVPPVGMIRSLNISVACAVSIYEAFASGRQPGYMK